VGYYACNYKGQGAEAVSPRTTTTQGDGKITFGGAESGYNIQKALAKEGGGRWPRALGRWGQ